MKKCRQTVENAHVMPQYAKQHLEIISHNSTQLKKKLNLHILKNNELKD